MDKIESKIKKMLRKITLVSLAILLITLINLNHVTLYSQTIKQITDQSFRLNASENEKAKSIDHKTLATTQAGGIIRGKIVDKTTGEGIMEAMLQIRNTSIVTGTDSDGNYILLNIPEGKYTLSVSYISYQTLIMENVIVRNGEVTVMNGSMEEDGITTDEVLIEAKAIKNNESSIIQMQRLSTVSMDGISQAQAHRNGDNTAAVSLSRVTGLSIEGGKYVYVRGLGDRYNKTLINGTEIPGIDPTRNAVQLDMYPSNLIDNLAVYKAFSPDLPGSFAGGLIDISTRDFPDKFFLSTGLQFGINTQATFNKNYLLYPGGEMDWFGFDDGSRAEPREVQGKNKTLPVVNQKFDRSESAKLTDRVTKEFGSNMYPTVQNNFLDHSLNFSVGNQILFLKRPLGFIASVSFRRQYSYYENGVEALWKSSGVKVTELNNLYNYNDRMGQENALLGSLATFSYKISNNHRLSMTIIHNHGGEASGRYQEGDITTDNFGQVRQNRVIQYQERNTNILQLRGENFFSKIFNSRLEWITSYVRMTQSDPDLRFFTNHYETNEDGSREYKISIAQYDPPTRYFRFYNEVGVDNKFHWITPIKKESKIKFGAFYTAKIRAPFREKWYQYKGPSLDNYNGNPEDLFAQKNLGVDSEGNNWKMYIQDVSVKSNSYDGKEIVSGGYAMGDIKISPKWRFVTGFRLESTNIEVVSMNPALTPAKIFTYDFLPCFNLIYRPTDKTNVRLNYGRTVARPIMREMASYANFEFIGGYLIIGNNNLKRSLIDNFDFRFEIFPSTQEIITISAFYKNFDSPIERVINPKAGGSSTEINFRNVDKAVNYGLELEIKKKFLKNFSAGVNASLINSQVKIAADELALLRAYDPAVSESRRMFAQSPYLINGNIGFQNDSLGISLNAVYNVFGPRIMEIGTGGSPNVYEQPRHSLDMNVQKKIGSFTFRLQFQNILNPKFRFIQTYRGKDYTFREFSIGSRISLGITYEIK